MLSVLVPCHKKTTQSHHFVFCDVFSFLACYFFCAILLTFGSVSFSHFIVICIMVRVFANVPGDLGLISGPVMTKTQKMGLDASLLNTQHYKLRIKGKWSNPRKEECPPLYLGVVAIEKGTFMSLSFTVS